MWLDESIKMTEIEELKKEIWVRDVITDEWIIDEEAVKKWVGEMQ